MRIKLATFPFTRYGVLEGIVRNISADASRAKDALENRAPADRLDPKIKALVSLKAQHLSYGATRLAIAAGMQVNAEIEEGQRTVIEYLLSPVPRFLAISKFCRRTDEAKATTAEEMTVSTHRNWSEVARCIVAGLFVSILLASLSACAKDDKVEWTEDVQLSDGTVIKVKVTRFREKAGEIARPSYLTKRSALEITAPNDQRIQWAEDYLNPLLLDRDPKTQDFLLVVTASSEGRWRELGSPRPPYWQFRQRNGAWTREPVSEDMWERSANLLLLTPDESHRSHVSLEYKRAMNSDARLGRYYAGIHRDAFLGDGRPQGEQTPGNE